MRVDIAGALARQSDLTIMHTLNCYAGVTGCCRHIKATEARFATFRIVAVTRAPANFPGRDPACVRHVVMKPSRRNHCTFPGARA